MYSGDNSEITEQDEANAFLRQERSNLLAAARQEFTDTKEAARRVTKDLLLRTADEAQKRWMMETKTEDEDSERTKIAYWRLFFERTATYAALNSSD